MSSNSESNTRDNSGDLADEQTQEQEARENIPEPESAAETLAAETLNEAQAGADNVADAEADAEAQAIADAEIEAGAAIALLALELIAEFDAQEAEADGPHLTIVPVAKLASEHVRNVIEAALFAADEALTVDRLFKLFMPEELADENGRGQIRDALEELEAACESRGFELKKVASGYRMQVRQNLSPWVSRLWEEKPPRYTRALLETMALIAYKQPATRGDIEEVRGVAVSSNIMRTLLERGWIREVGHRDVPGRPSMYGTTKEFLDYFNLSSLDQLPSLPEVRELVEPAQTPDQPVVELVDETADATKAGAADDEAVDEAADPDDLVEELAAALDDAETVGQLDDEQVDDAPDELADDVSDAVVEVAPGDELKGVDMPDAGAGVTNSSAPVFADNEVLVVSESASVEVQQSSELTTLPSADSQE